MTAPTASFPASLGAIFQGGGGSMVALADKDSLKAMIRKGIEKAGKNPAEYTDKDVDGLATAIQEAGREFAERHKAELDAGNLSSETIRGMSRELALRVRVKMTPQNVGAFAAGVGPLGMISQQEIITGVDEKGAITRPYEMTIQGMSEAALTSTFGSDAAKNRYREQIAFEENHRAFYAGEGREGVTPELAADTARFRMEQAGKYTKETQDAIAAAAEHAFQPSSALSGIWGWLKELFTAIVALFSGDTSKITALFTGDHSERHERDAAQKNLTLYHNIMDPRSTPEALGYTGAPQDFAAWRQQLATDVTGIRPGASGVYVDHTNGASQGIAAVIQGLDANGNSRLPGQENVRGVNHDHVQRTQYAPVAPRSPSSGYAPITLPGDEDIAPPLNLPGGRPAPSHIR